MSKLEKKAGDETLSQLRQDHAHFSFLLGVLEREADTLDAGAKADIVLIKNIVSYFEEYPAVYHHPKEDLIYGHLILHLPTFGESVFALLKDHERLPEQTGRLKSTLERVDPYDPDGLRRLGDETRAFVEHERQHLRSEEELFFPNAERYLTAEQWAEADRVQPKITDPLFHGRDYRAVFELITTRGSSKPALT